jgi:glycosyltransferase involved in cell wall biosynthesis
MHWWIIEDALRDRKGHWSEYLQTFRRGLEAEGDEVRIFAARECEPALAAVHGAESVLPKSIWARMSDGVPRWRRLLRIPSHGFATYRTISKLLSGCSALHAPLRPVGSPSQRRSSLLPAGRASPDLIFVPTVLVHHLAGWVPLIKWKLRDFRGGILLFFPNAPVYLDDNGMARIAADPTAKLFKLCIRLLAKDVAAGKVVLGAETEPMTKALTEATGVPFTYLPHPVELSAKHSPTTRNSSPAASADPIVFGCYGAARYEKGSDILQRAIALALAKRPDMPARFVFQWMEDFADGQGGMVHLDCELEAHPKVQVIREHFSDGGYERQLAATDVMLLPYRNPYRLRVSRVVIEGMILGLPLVVTRGTTLWDQASRYGCAKACDEDSAESVAEAILALLDGFEEASRQAKDCQIEALRHFSVAEFRRRLLSPAPYGLTTDYTDFTNSSRNELRKRDGDALRMPFALLGVGMFHLA